MKNTQKLKKTRLCNMCGSTLPHRRVYSSQWCWMCWRNIWEKGYYRYYVKTENSYWEEVQSIRGLSPFSEKNKLIIKKAMIEEREKLPNNYE